ncbi:hypothetical protein [Haloferax sp. DFSO52]|uniref:hypothetical protein n=1 Tax=Haloferax sp. DFSO52 TaxID=3388505 RepID=UPI003A8BB4D1
MEEANPELSFDYNSSQNGNLGFRIFGDTVSNYSATDLASQEAEISVAANSGHGLGAVGALGTTKFYTTTWTAPCTGNYTVTFEYELDGDVAQHRGAGSYAKGVSRVTVNSRVTVVEHPDVSTWNAIREEKHSEWNTTIPTLETLGHDGLRSLFAATVSRITGFPVGSVAAEEVGIDPRETEIERSISTADGQVSVTFYAQEDRQYLFVHTLEAGAIAASIVGEADAQANVVSEVTNVTVRPANTAEMGDGETSAPSSTSDQPMDNTLTVLSTSNERAHYEIAIDGEVALGAQANPVDAEYPDTVTGQTAQGSVAKYGTDTYQFSGTVTNVNLEGPATILVNGERLDLPVSNGSGKQADGSDLSNTVTIVSTSDERAFYQILVSGQAGPGAGADLTGALYPDTVSDNRIRGSSAEYGTDSFRFSGEVTTILLSGPANVLINGQEVDPSDYGGEQQITTIRIVSTSEERAFYDFTASGTVLPGDEADMTGATHPDLLIDGVASGSVANSGSDTFQFTGELVEFRLNGSAEVYVDGERVTLELIRPEAVSCKPTCTANSVSVTVVD